MRKLKYKLDPRILVATIICNIGYSLVVTNVMIPYGLLSGGVTGVAMLFQESLIVFGANIPLSFIILLLNVPILYLGFKKISIKYVILSAVAIATQTIFLAIPPIFDAVELIGDDKLTGAILTGLGVGLFTGYGLKIGSNSGGSDVLFQYLSLSYGFSIGTLSIILNAVVLSVSLSFYSPSAVIYTLFSIIITSIVVDKVHTSYNQIMLEIVSSHTEEISKRIYEVTGRGSTLLKGYGAYQKKDINIIHTVFNVHQYRNIRSVLNEVDPNAFVTMSSVRRISGTWTKTTMT